MKRITLPTLLAVAVLAPAFPLLAGSATAVALAENPAVSNPTRRAQAPAAQDNPLRAFVTYPSGQPPADAPEDWRAVLPN